MTQRRNVSTLPSEVSYRHWSNVGIHENTNRTNNNNNNDITHVRNTTHSTPPNTTTNNNRTNNNTTTTQTTAHNIPPNTHTQRTLHPHITTTPQPTQPPRHRFKPSTLPPPKNYTQLDLHSKKITNKQTTQRRENRKQKTLLSQRSKAQKHLRNQLRQRFTQTSIQGQQRHDSDEHGNKTSNRNKPNDVYRIASRNTDKFQTHIPPGHRQESTLSKDKQIADEITKLEADCYCHQEHAINWDLIPAEDQWRDRTRNTMPLHTAYFAYNKTEPKQSQEKAQWGGTGIFAMQRTIPKIVDNDVDPSGLGRWTWIKLQGKQGHRVRIISAYRPCAASKQSA